MMQKINHFRLVDTKKNRAGTNQYNIAWTKSTRNISASCVDENVSHTGCKLVSYYDSDNEDEEDGFVTIALNTIQWTGP